MPPIWIGEAKFFAETTWHASAPCVKRHQLFFVIGGRAGGFLNQLDCDCKSELFNALRGRLEAHLAEKRKAQGSIRIRLPHHAVDNFELCSINALRAFWQLRFEAFAKTLHLCAKRLAKLGVAHKGFSAD